jgi:nitrite reductase/ring-hydroxylating ferredoxin subunit
MDVRYAMAEIPDGESRQLRVETGRPIAIHNVGGIFYATEDTCTHGDASLCDGMLDGCIVECPFHGGSFDVRTGEAVTYPAHLPLRTFPAAVVGDFIVVSVD